ncbi:unnamed protein product, partial [Prorocentrum cordatum]
MALRSQAWRGAAWFRARPCVVALADVAPVAAPSSQPGGRTPRPTFPLLSRPTPRHPLGNGRSPAPRRRAFFATFLQELPENRSKPSAGAPGARRPCSKGSTSPAKSFEGPPLPAGLPAPAAAQGVSLPAAGELPQIEEDPRGEEHGELRGAAAAALCRILAQALRKGALALEPAPEEAQDELLRSLEALLCAPQEETRARVCEGLLSILQASGQELYPAAWGTIIRLVATGARVELERVGVQFFLPTALDPLAAAAEDGADGSAVQHQSFVVVAAEGRESSTVLPQLFQLLELLVHDFMEHVPLAAVPRLTGSIGAFARFGGLGVNSSLTAVGFLWKVADFLAGPVGVAAAG